MSRAALLCAPLAACATPEAPTPLGVPLTGSCAVLEDSTGLTVQAASEDGTVFLQLDHAVPDALREGVGNAAYELANLADEPPELHIYTGVDLGPPCADPTADASWLADYRAIGGSMYLSYVNGGLGTVESGTVDVAMTHLVLRSGEDDAFYYGDLRLGTIPIETPADVVE